MNTVIEHMKKTQTNKIGKLLHVQKNHRMAFSTSLISSARQRNWYVQKNFLMHRTYPKHQEISVRISLSA